MKRLFVIYLLGTLVGCQHKPVIRPVVPRLKLTIVAPSIGAVLQVGHTYALGLTLQTDAVAAQYGYQLLYTQQTGFGHLEWNDALSQQEIISNVPVVLPSGPSTWWYTPQAIGDCHVSLLAYQPQGYTLPDTLQLSFQVIP